MILYHSPVKVSFVPVPRATPGTKGAQWINIDGYCCLGDQEVFPKGKGALMDV